MRHRRCQQSPDDALVWKRIGRTNGTVSAASKRAEGQTLQSRGCTVHHLTVSRHSLFTVALVGAARNAAQLNRGPEPPEIIARP